MWERLLDKARKSQRDAKVGAQEKKRESVKLVNLIEEKMC